MKCAVNPLISPPRTYLFQAHLGGGGLFNFAKTIVSIFLKEPKNKVEKFKYKKLEVMQPRIKNKSALPSLISPYEVLQSGD